MRYILYFIFILGFLSCRQEGNHLPERKTGQSEETDNSLIEINKFLVKKDARLILAYIDRMNWDMKIDSAGYWYEILSEGNGPKAQPGKTITLEYTLHLLDGTKVYSSSENGPKAFKIGQGGIESGLELGVLQLQEGDSARFIFPPHLAHGLIGDGERIPARSSIVYHLKVTDLSP
ncbi:MAG: FKBP-type peptidyl-prolyl cis-trans isomerase [Bacteroidota bacterium]